jgi:hypothetical protein
MSFKNIALPIAKLGIPVFPLQPKVKEPPPGMKFLEEATTDPNKIEQWNSDNPNYNVAMLADGEYGFLEFDIPDGIEQACTEKHQPRPVTREQLSGGGGQHFVFKMSDDTKALGNRSISLPTPCTCSKQDNQAACVVCSEPKAHHHHEWFSFRARNKYLVGAGSTHPNGKPYKLTQNVVPAEMPTWLSDWIRERSSPSKAADTTKPKGTLPIHRKFDPTDFWDFYGIDIDFVKDGVWYVVSECPGVGHKHRHSKLTAFYWDGDNLGWSCFAQGCPTTGMSIGQLIKFLNKTHDPYKKPIWEDDENWLDDFDIDILDIGFDAKVDDVETVPMTAAKQAPKPETPKKPRLVVIGTSNSGDEERSLIGVRASDVTPKLFRWLWNEKIPQALTLWVGKPDNGKSLGLLDLAARVSRGDDWPDGEKNAKGPQVVLYCATEDSTQMTLVPRLMAAKANLENIVFPRYVRVKEKKDKHNCRLNLKNDLTAIKNAVLETPEIALIVFDPMNSYWPDVDENKAKEIAPVLEAVAKFTEDTGVTVIGLIHHSKRSDTDALGKVLGSVRVGGIARAVWEISKEKDKQSTDPGAIRMALVKGNVHRKRTGMKYHIEGVPLVIEGETTSLPRIVWDGILDKSADELLDDQKQEEKEGHGDNKLLLAVELIRSSLPMTPPDLMQKGQDEGIARATMYRAKEKIDESDDPIYSEQISSNRKERRWWLTSQWQEHLKATDVKPADPSQVF